MVHFMNIIETKNLTKKFEKMTAVHTLNLQIKEGKIFRLLGPNGTGKTTTLLILDISRFPLLFDFAHVYLFALVMILIGTYAFKKMKI